jgi:cold shock protein
MQSTDRGTARVTGTVKWFNNRRGFGFIEQGEGLPDAFVHFSNIVADGFRKLEDGQQVTFVPSEGDKGPCALEVVPGELVS